MSLRDVFLLVADIGGTNIRLGHCSQESNAAISDIQGLLCGEFPTPLAAIQQYCTQQAIRPKHVCLAIAGPVRQDSIALTNNHWRFHQSTLCEELHLNHLLCINDFTAQAYAAAYYLQHYHALNQPAPTAEHDNAPLCAILHANKPPACKHNVLIIGPGTGLGVSCVSFLTHAGMRFTHVIQGEGGHIGIAPHQCEDLNLLRWLWREDIPLCYESLISGQGLENIYRFLSTEHRTAQEIGQAALDSHDTARDAVHIMLGYLGKIAADCCLAFGAWDGIVLAGGVMPKLYPLLASSPFAERLYQHTDMPVPLEGLPVYMLSEPTAGLVGAQQAFFARQNHASPQ